MDNKNTPLSALSRDASGALMMDGVDLASLARTYGTPTYVYSAAAIRENFMAYKRAFGAHEHLVCYAVKANSNLAVLSLLAKLGAGFDIVSGGELKRVIAAGGDPHKVIFSGVGKTASEIEFAIEAGVHCFNIESESELERINAIAAKLGKTARISVRVNPDVDAKTHPYISTGLKNNKFGVPHHRVLPVYRRAKSLPHIQIVGIEAHIGSLIMDDGPLLTSLDKLAELMKALAAEGIDVEHIDNGGGLGVSYTLDTPSPDVQAYIEQIVRRVGGLGKMLLVEPGRSIVANAGVLLTQVEYLKTDKDKGFAIVDASMSELLRPMLYQAHHEIVELNSHSSAARASYDIVGPVCESSDVLGRDRTLAIAQGDYLAVLSAGAYGFVMASNYNTRSLPTEILIDGGKASVIRPRQSLDEILASEVEALAKLR
jgi:diaminopimelate decarboxylase